MESTDTLTRARVTDLADLADGALLSEATEIEALLREAEVHKLRIASQWALAHPALDACETPSGPALPAALTAPETLGGSGHARRRRVHPRAAGGGVRMLARVGFDVARRCARPAPPSSAAVGPGPGADGGGLEGEAGRHPHAAPLVRRCQVG